MQSQSSDGGVGSVFGSNVATPMTPTNKVGPQINKKFVENFQNYFLLQIQIFSLPDLVLLPDRACPRAW